MQRGIPEDMAPPTLSLSLALCQVRGNLNLSTITSSMQSCRCINLATLIFLLLLAKANRSARGRLKGGLRQGIILAIGPSFR